MEKEKLKIENGVREIEVNDAGECIYIPMNDNTFFKRINDFLEWLEQKQAALEKEAARQPEIDNEAPEANISVFTDTIKMQAGLCEEICGELDKLFGEGCCRKVFVGVQSPDIVLIWDFIEQLMPLLQKFARERKEKVHFKYNRKRKGART